MTIGNVVRKEFICGTAEQRVTDLVAIYESLKQKNVPHVDSLDSYDVNVKHPYVFLSPVGSDVWPDSGSDAFNAVTCVLAALKVRYDVSVFII
jgi:L-2-hydroxyglutarate oxidase LhgO